MVMKNQQLTTKTKLQLHNSSNNKINKYIMMTRTIRSTMMNMDKPITTKISSNMLTTVIKTISNTTRMPSTRIKTSSNIITSIDATKL